MYTTLHKYMPGLKSYSLSDEIQSSSQLQRLEPSHVMNISWYRLSCLVIQVVVISCSSAGGEAGARPLCGCSWCSTSLVGEPEV
mmetsp:Transcript_27204/g.59428  ORF Transcript_27204/g.59428 Transcript_27204/m.59428 type:complete len:84 (-) Transcript_27204:2498-2749(-)